MTLAEYLRFSIRNCFLPKSLEPKHCNTKPDSAIKSNMLHHYGRQPIVINKSAPKGLKPPVKLTPAQKAGIIKMKKEGARSSLIVEKYNVAEHAIQKTWTKYLKEHPEQKRVTTANRAKMDKTTFEGVR